MGDCFYASPEGVMTLESASRLRAVILGSVAEHYIEGHDESVSSRIDMERQFEQMQLAERAVREDLVIEAPDGDTEYFIAAFRAGLATSS